MSKNNLFDEWNIDNKKSSNDFSKKNNKTVLSTPKKEIKTGVEKYYKVMFISFSSVFLLVSFVFFRAIYPQNTNEINEISQTENKIESGNQGNNVNNNSEPSKNSDLSSNTKISEQNKTESKEQVVVNQEDINKIKETETVKPKTEEELRSEKEEKNKQLEELKVQEGINGRWKSTRLNSSH